MPFNILRILKPPKKGQGKAFQILSDLHLEVGNQYQSFNIPKVAQYLILAGDIGRLIDYDQYLALLQRQTSQFELVFLVLGNHEFYGTTFPNGLVLAERMASESSLNGKLILLNRSRYDIPDTTITLLGCTLWTNVTPESADVVRAKISDFRRIDGWSVSNHNAAHTQDSAWLTAEITALTSIQNQYPAFRRKILVVTHHAPLRRGTSGPKNEENEWSSAFATDILAAQELTFKWEGMSTWVFGHTHFSTDFIDYKSNVRVIANQRGYILPGIAAQRLDSTDTKEAQFNVRKIIHV